MAICPKCNTDIDEDFGLVDCPGCGVAVLIGIDGDVKVASGEPYYPPAVPSHEVPPMAEPQTFGENSFAENVSELDEEATNFNFSVDAESAELEEAVVDDSDQFGFATDEPVSESMTNFNSFEQPEAVEATKEQQTNSQAMLDEFTSFGEAPALEEPVVEATSHTPIEQFESEEVYEEVVEELNDEKTNFLAESEIAKSKKTPPQTGLANLSDYANSKKSSLKDGYLKYKLYIGGIDTNEIKKQVFEELADKKLLLDLGELNKKIEDGNLCIEPISAVKASILINRLKSISVTIAWDQYDIRKA